MLVSEFKYVKVAQQCFSNLYLSRTSYINDICHIGYYLQIRFPNLKPQIHCKIIWRQTTFHIMWPKLPLFYADIALYLLHVHFSLI